jgi:Domain of unkown function (DUF1775)
MYRKIALLVSGVGLAVPAGAQAHVSIHPNVIPTGANAALSLRVPNEQDNARTTKLQIQFPPGFIGASLLPPPGFTARVITSKLAKPVQTDDGPHRHPSRPGHLHRPQRSGDPTGAVRRLRLLRRRPWPSRGHADLQDRPDLRQRQRQPLDRRPQQRLPRPDHRHHSQERLHPRLRRQRGRARGTPGVGDDQARGHTDHHGGPEEVRRHRGHHRPDRRRAARPRRGRRRTHGRTPSTRVDLARTSGTTPSLP